MERRNRSQFGLLFDFSILFHIFCLLLLFFMVYLINSVLKLFEDLYRNFYLVMLITVKPKSLS